jgi:hypothetical protein
VLQCCRCRLRMLRLSVSDNHEAIVCRLTNDARLFRNNRKHTLQQLQPLECATFLWNVASHGNRNHVRVGNLEYTYEERRVAGRTCTTYKYLTARRDTRAYVTPKAIEGPTAAYEQSKGAPVCRLAFLPPPSEVSPDGTSASTASSLASSAERRDFAVFTSQCSMSLTKLERSHLGRHAHRARRKFSFRMTNDQACQRSMTGYRYDLPGTVLVPDYL